MRHIDSLAAGPVATTTPTPREKIMQASAARANVACTCGHPGGAHCPFTHGCYAGAPSPTVLVPRVSCDQRVIDPVSPERTSERTGFPALVAAT
jgi:hypothetical protein